MISSKYQHKFESFYQSIYVDNPIHAINKDGSLRIELMEEFISEPFRKYMIGESISDMARKLIEKAIP